MAAYAGVGLQPSAPAAFRADLRSVHHYLFRSCGRGDHLKRISYALALSGAEATLLYLINVYKFVPFKSILKMLYLLYNFRYYKILYLCGF